MYRLNGGNNPVAVFGEYKSRAAVSGEKLRATLNAGILILLFGLLRKLFFCASCKNRCDFAMDSYRP